MHVQCYCSWLHDHVTHYRPHSFADKCYDDKYGFCGTERPNFFLSLLKSLSKIIAKSWNIHISGRHYVQKEHPLKGHFFPGKITKTHIGEIYRRVLAISTAISLLRVCIEKKSYYIHNHNTYMGELTQWLTNDVSLILFMQEISIIKTSSVSYNFLLRLQGKGAGAEAGVDSKKDFFFYMMKNSSIRNRHTLTYQTQLYYKNNNLLIHPKKDILCQLRLIKFKFFTPFTYTYKCGFGLEWAIAY